MAKETNRNAPQGELIVKNKKFKKSDILVFCVCLVVSLVIWIYATNVELNKANENPSGDTETSQQA